MKSNKFLSVLLCFTMILSLFPIQVFAGEAIINDGQIIESSDSIYEIRPDTKVETFIFDEEGNPIILDDTSLNNDNIVVDNNELQFNNELIDDSILEDDGLDNNVESCSCVDGIHIESCYLYEKIDSCTCNAETSIHSVSCPLYVADDKRENECNCEYLNNVHDASCPMYVEITNQCTCNTTDGVHFDGCSLYIAPTCSCELVNGTHNKDCYLYVEEEVECTCNTESDIHKDDCPLYVVPTCTCGNEVHTIECALYIESISNFNILISFETLNEIYDYLNNDLEFVEILTDEEKDLVVEKVENIYSSINEPTENDLILKNSILNILNRYIIEICLECGLTNGEHADDCVNKIIKCDECNGINNEHLETCSKFIGNKSIYEELLDASLQEMHDILINPENEENLEKLSSEEIEEIIYQVGLIADDEDLEIEVLMMLYELPNAPLPPWMTLETNYIYFDLYYGNVSITGTTYSGYDSTGAVVSGVHEPENEYYIYQSKGDSTVWENGLPVYDSVTYNGQYWGDYITNHPANSTKGSKSVDEVIAAWGSVSHKATTATSGAAFNAGRLPTANYIKVQGNSTFNVVIDDIWSSYQVKYSTSQQNASSFKNDLGGFVYIPEKTDALLNLYLVGDNRFGNLHAATHDGTNGKYTVDTNHTNTITIQTLSGENDATLTLCNIWTNADTNSTASCIGGTDGRDHSAKMIFNSGIVYAGSGYKDFCTAIGGGGNGDGRVIINGGIITAVNSSTGAAIGGGCGTTGAGGYGEVHINDGEVYAYSYAVYYASGSYYNNALPTAIGGGSSGTQIGGKGIVDISGGYVYAYSEKGNAIGGGGGGYGLQKSSDTTYDSATGGIADVNISGGIIHAISGSGCAIGGGPGGGRSYDAYYTKNSVLPNDTLNPGNKVVANGGNATLTITGGTIYTGSIGGGSPQFHDGTDKNKYGFTIGAAEVYISGGETHGQIVMEGAGSAFEMNNGIIDNTFVGSEYHFVKNDGGAVYIKTGNAVVNGGIIQNCNAGAGGAIYIDGGDFIMYGGTITNCEAVDGGAIYVKGGNIDIYNGTIDSNTASNNGGAIYATSDTTDILINVFDGQITNNTAGNHAGAIGASVDGELKITINIGEEECLGANKIHHDDFECPIIKNNVANFFGGAFCLHGNANGLLVNVYCGDVDGNLALRYPGSNTINQEGGKFAIYGGIIDPGVMVGGGIFEDNRVDAKTIKVRFWGNYEGAPTEPVIIECTLGVTLNFPANTYVNGTHELSGWTNVPNSQTGWVPVGGQYAVYEDDDEYLDYYAVWDAVVGFIIYIPDTWDIGVSGVGEMDISADLNYFKKDSNLEVIVNSDFILTNVEDSSDILYYELRTNEPGINYILSDGDLVASFQYNNTGNKTLTANVLNILNSGTYEGLLTFTIKYSES